MIKFLSLLMLECTFFILGTSLGVWVCLEYSPYPVFGALVLAGSLIVWNVRRDCSYMDAGFKEIEDERG